MRGLVTTPSQRVFSPFPFSVYARASGACDDWVGSFASLDYFSGLPPVHVHCGSAAAKCRVVHPGENVNTCSAEILNSVLALPDTCLVEQLAIGPECLLVATAV